MGQVYEKVKAYVSKYPGGIYWFRLKKHSQIIETHLNPGEEILFAFAGQKNDSLFDVFSTSVIVLTKDRILMGQKRLLWGYALTGITPDLFNDLQVYEGVLWGKVVIDTVKECVTISKLAKKALPEIETAISSYMMEEKKKYNTVYVKK